MGLFAALRDLFWSTTVDALPVRPPQPAAPLRTARTPPPLAPGLLDPIEGLTLEAFAGIGARRAYLLALLNDEQDAGALFPEGDGAGDPDGAPEEDEEQDEEEEDEEQDEEEEDDEEEDGFPEDRMDPILLDRACEGWRTRLDGNAPAELGVRHHAAWLAAFREAMEVDEPTLDLARWLEVRVSLCKGLGEGLSIGASLKAMGVTRVAFLLAEMHHTHRVATEPAFAREARALEAQHRSARGITPADNYPPI